MVETQSAPEGFSLSGHKTHKLQESDMTKAPIFEINDSDGKPFKMEDHFPMVLYFYPKDSTSGCTTEAKEFTALIPEFQKLGYDVVGVSRDSERATRTSSAATPSRSRSSLTRKKRPARRTT